jgi:hypothetical protein
MPELIAGDERRRRIRAAARQPAGDRYPLADRHGDPGRDVRASTGACGDRLAEYAHGAQRQVFTVGWHLVGALSGHGHAVRVGGRDGHLVE